MTPELRDAESQGRTQGFLDGLTCGISLIHKLRNDPQTDEMGAHEALILLAKEIRAVRDQEEA